MDMIIMAVAAIIICIILFLFQKKSGEVGRLENEITELKRMLEQKINEFQQVKAKYTLDFEQAEANLNEAKAGGELALSAAQQELDVVKNKLESTRKELKEVQQQPATQAEAGGDDERDRLRQQLAEKTNALEELETNFESKMDEVVQSSIQKIAHAEEAKEEAIQAASDNYDAAAEAYAVIKEKDALIKKMQDQ